MSKRVPSPDALAHRKDKSWPSWEAPPGEMTGEGKQNPGNSYRTGREYPVPGEEDGSGPKTEEDIYGEGEVPYTDEEDVPADGAPDNDVSPLDRLLDDEKEGPEPTRAGSPLKIEVIHGPDTGKKRRFNGVRMVIGRVPECDFVLSDQSVSRRHLEIVQGEQGALLRDLGSGNGSKVNGEKVAEHALKHGDEISLGKTRFRFLDDNVLKQEAADAEAVAAKAAQEAAAQAQVDDEKAKQQKQAEVEQAAEEALAKLEGRPAQTPGEEGEEVGPSAALVHSTVERPAFAPARSRQKVGWAALDTKQRALILGGTVTLVILVFVIIGLMRKPAPAPVVNPRDQQAAEKMQLARTAVRAERYDEAVELVGQAEKLQPGIDTEGFKALAQNELDAQKGLDKVRAMVTEGKLDEAATALGALPEPTSDKRRQAIAELKKFLEDKRSEALENGIDAAIAQKDMDAAQNLFEKLPAARQAELAPKLDQARNALAKERAEEQHVAAVAAEASRRRTKAEREAFLEDAFGGVARKFHGREFDRAVMECDRVEEEYRADPDVRTRSAELRKLIPMFQRVFEDGQSKYKANSLEGAARSLRKARDLYGQIHLPGALGAVINEELAASSLAAGKVAQARGDLATAAINYREALKLNPMEAQAKEGLQRLAHSAEDLYLDAYMLRDRDPREALSKFRIVLEMADPDSLVHEKAQKQIELLVPH